MSLIGSIGRWMVAREATAKDRARIDHLLTMADGKKIRSGQRVVLDKEVLTKWGLGHAWDDQVHVATVSIWKCGSVVITLDGVRQEGAAALRSAPC